LSGRRAIVCVGSGGVGKTSVAAALAVSAARQGRRVLALTVDPAPRLADSLGVDRASGDWQTLDAARSERLGITKPGALEVGVLDAERTLRQLIQSLVRDDEARARLVRHPLFEPLGKYLAGAGEYMAMEKLLQALSSADHDLVVLDTPPSRHALDLFEAPERVRRAVTNPVLSALLRSLPGAGSRRADWLGRGIRMATKGIGRLTGEATLEQITTLVEQLPPVLSGFGERARELGDALQRPDFAYVLVTRPTAVSVELARSFSQELERRSLGADLLVINRVSRVPAREVIARGLEQLGPRVSEKLFGAVRSALADGVSRTEREQAQIAELVREHVLQGCPRLELPALQVGVSDLAELANLADRFGRCWGGQSAAKSA
jgi:anion-transporting  ArsA/GET3 family ATPase